MRLALLLMLAWTAACVYERTIYPQVRIKSVGASQAYHASDTPLIPTSHWLALTAEQRPGRLSSEMMVDELVNDPFMEPVIVALGSKSPETIARALESDSRHELTTKLFYIMSISREYYPLVPRILVLGARFEITESTSAYAFEMFQRIFWQQGDDYLSEQLIKSLHNRPSSMAQLLRFYTSASHEFLKQLIHRYSDSFPAEFAAFIRNLIMMDLRFTESFIDGYFKDRIVEITPSNMEFVVEVLRLAFLAGSRRVIRHLIRGLTIRYESIAVLIVLLDPKDAKMFIPTVVQSYIGLYPNEFTLFFRELVKFQVALGTLYIVFDQLDQLRLDVAQYLAEHLVNMKQYQYLLPIYYLNSAVDSSWRDGFIDLALLLDSPHILSLAVQDGADPAITAKRAFDRGQTKCLLYLLRCDLRLRKPEVIADIISMSYELFSHSRIGSTNDIKYSRVWTSLGKDYGLDQIAVKVSRASSGSRKALIRVLLHAFISTKNFDMLKQLLSSIDAFTFSIPLDELKLYQRFIRQDPVLVGVFSVLGAGDRSDLPVETLEEYLESGLISVSDIFLYISSHGRSISSDQVRHLLSIRADPVLLDRLLLHPAMFKLAFQTIVERDGGLSRDKARQLKHSCIQMRCPPKVLSLIQPYSTRFNIASSSNNDQVFKTPWWRRLWFSFKKLFRRQ